MVVLVVAVVLIGSGGSNESAPTTSSRTLTVTVKALKPVGGIKELVVKQGQRARYVVTSDRPEEIHTHGYNIARDVAPGKPARFDFVANISGIFAVERAPAGVQIMKLTVEP